MKQNGSTIAPTDLDLGDHLCFLFKTEEERRAMVTAFIRDGLIRDEKIIYVMDGNKLETVQGYLDCLPSKELHGDCDVERCLANGQVNILHFVEAHGYGREFEPERMIRLLRDETKLALAEGYSGLRITCEMTWALQRMLGSERFIEYEARSNSFYSRNRCLAMCQYDCTRFSPAMLLYALATHPMVAVGAQMFDNLYHNVPPPFFGHEPASTSLAHWLNDLSASHASFDTLQSVRRVAEQ